VVRIRRLPPSSSSRRRPGPTSAVDTGLRRYDGVWVRYVTDAAPWSLIRWRIRAEVGCGYRRYHDGQRDAAEWKGPSRAGTARAGGSARTAKPRRCNGSAGSAHGAGTEATFPYLRSTPPAAPWRHSRPAATGWQGIKSHPRFSKENSMGRGILLWMLGVPIPIILLLALIWH
jgi:hypothetical protein